MIKYWRILPFIGLCLAMGGCNVCLEIDHRQLGPESLAHFGSHKQGSWWVYERQADKVRDSIYLTNYAKQIQPTDAKSSCSDQEIIRYRLIGKGILCDTSTATIDARGNNDNISLSGNHKSNLFNISMYTRNGEGYERGPYGDFDQLPTYTVQGVTYSNVTKVYAKAPVGSGQSSNFVVWRVLYLAPEVGLIRAEYAPTPQGGLNETFDLINYKIAN